MDETDLTGIAVPAAAETMRRLAEAVQRLRDSGAAVIVGIDGPGASGKSTVADELCARVDGVVIHGDDFYLPSSDRPDQGSHGYCFDLQRLQRQVLVPARRGLPVRYDVYDWLQDRIGPQVVVPDHSPIFVEGVYTTRKDLAGFYGYRVVVWAPRAVRLDRGLSRDGESARQQWVQDWMPAEDRYFAGDRPQDRADMVIRTA